MSKSFVISICIMFLLSVFLLAPKARSDELEEGKSLYDSNCTLCHGMQGKGNGPAASTLSPAPVDFTKAPFWQQENLDQLITHTIKDGHGPMPAFSNLSDDQIKAIIDYMTKTFK